MTPKHTNGADIRKLNDMLRKMTDEQFEAAVERALEKMAEAGKLPALCDPHSLADDIALMDQEFLDRMSGGNDFLGQILAGPKPS